MHQSLRQALNPSHVVTHNNYWLAGIIATLSFTHAATGLAATVRLFQIKTFARLPEVLGVMSATLIIMAVNDLFITIVLCLSLRKAGSTFTETQSAIRLLIVYTIETGLLTSVFVTIDAICILVMPHNWIFIVLTSFYDKPSHSVSVNVSSACFQRHGMAYNALSYLLVYANSLLTILNSRHSLTSKNSTSKISAASARQSNVLTSLRMQELSMNKCQELSPITPSFKPEADFVSSPQSPHRLTYAV
ncbi:hypothetical protein K439DRAFT_1613163 [Ramaria rubella]|nr:hypothetical protein K439DRAFT_1613163 [Ramaria rubella]